MLIREQDPIVGENTDRQPVDPCETRDDGASEPRLELVQPGAVGDTGDYFANIVRRPEVAGYHAVQLFRVVERILRLNRIHARAGARTEAADDLPRKGKGMGIVLGQMVGHTGKPRMKVSASEVLGRNALSGRRLDQGRAAKEDRALVPDDHGLVRHGRYIRASCGAGPEYHGDLRIPRCGHLRWL